MSLSGKVLSAVKSNYLGTVVRIAAQLASQVFIMRELGPELIGTFGYALLLVGLLALVIDQGFGWSLIQGDFNADEVATAFTRLLIGGGLCAAVVVGMSYPIAAYLHNELAGQVIRYSTPSYLLIAFYAISHARLRRELRFKELQYATTGAYLIAYPIVGLGLAWAGFGVWSLLAAWYAQAVLQALIGHFYQSHSLRLANPLKRCAAGPLGRDVAGINVLNWAVDNASGVVVGGMGAASLGSFNAASVLGRQPALQLVLTLQGLLFSTASALDGDRARQRRLFLASFAVVCLVVLPIYGYLMAHAHFLVELLFGPKWETAAPVLVALGPGMVAMALSTVVGSVLTATGAQRAVVFSQGLCLIAMLPSLLFASTFSVVAVAWALSAGYVLRLLVQLRTTLRMGIATWSDYYLSLRGAVLLALVVALPVPTPSGVEHWPMLWELLVTVAVAMLGILLLWSQPSFVLAPAAIDALEKIGAGRKLLGWLQKPQVTGKGR